MNEETVFEFNSNGGIVFNSLEAIEELGYSVTFDVEQETITEDGLTKPTCKLKFAKLKIVKK